MASTASAPHAVKAAHATAGTCQNASHPPSQLSLLGGATDFGDGDESDGPEMIPTQPPSQESKHGQPVAPWRSEGGLMAVATAATLSDQSSAAFDSQVILPGRTDGGQQKWISSQETDESTETTISNESMAYGSTSTPSHGPPENIYYDNPLMSLADAAKQEIEASQKSSEKASANASAAVLTSLRNSTDRHARSSFDAATNAHFAAVAASVVRQPRDGSILDAEGEDEVEEGAEYGASTSYAYPVQQYGSYAYSNGYGAYAYEAEPVAPPTDEADEVEAMHETAAADAEEQMRDWGGNRTRRPRRQTTRRFVEAEEEDEMDDGDDDYQAEADFDNSSDYEDRRGPLGSGPAGSRADRRVAAAEKRKRAVAKMEASAVGKPKRTKKKRTGSTPAHAGPSVNRGGGSVKKPPRRHKCDECGKTFDRAFNLSQHLQATHRNIRNWICPIEPCGREFSRKNDRNRHCRTVHRDVDIPAERLAVPS